MKLRLLKEFFSEKSAKGGDIDVRFRFDELIKVTTAHFSYTKLELVAELGGYVGLFLGISVLHSTAVFEKFIKFISDESKSLLKARKPKSNLKRVKSI